VDDKVGFLIALLGALFFLFNRWTLHVVKVSEIDFVALMLLTIGLIGISRGSSLACLAIGFSLSIKQMAIFLVPLFLFWIWEDWRNNGDWRAAAINAAYLFVLPLIVITPFLFWNFPGFTQSVFVSVTRNPSVLGNIYSLDAFLGWVGLLAKLPMLFMFFLVDLATMKFDLGFFIPAMSIFIIFAAFNSVYFPSNFVWVTPLIPLSIISVVPGKNRNQALEND
jgi:uncharacterized membrane protein